MTKIPPSGLTGPELAEKLDEKRRWWRDPIVDRWEGALSDGGLSILVAIRNHELGLPAVTTSSWRGTGPSPVGVRRVVRGLGGSLVAKDLRDGMEVYLFDGGFASVEFEKREDGSSEVWCRWSSWDASLTRGILRLGKRFVSVSKSGQVEALVRDGGGGVTTRTLGIAAFPVERGNYQEEVLRDYDRACVELSSKTPNGRLLLIAGEPGTGKTYLLRGLVKEVSASAFVIVQPDTLASLSGPGLLSSVMSLREDRSKDGPIVMLCEDADELLVTRKMDNMSAISAFLNLCDGMIGEALDVRIVATTNAKDISIDVALRRPGRMIGYMRTKALSEAQAASVFRRLMPEVKLPELRGKTLADVYVAAREHGWVPPRPSEPSAFLDEAGRFHHRNHRHR